MTVALDARDDTGSTLPLTIFFGFLATVLVLVVVAATSLYLERKRLFTLADGAALVGAEAYALGDVRATASGVRSSLASREVAAAVGEYLSTAPTDEFADLRLERAESADGHSATVELSAYWRPPVLTLLLPEGLRIEVTSVARSVFS
ncbi:hypothetical protein BH09ACT5_BH09ACT5_12600 [soil metagenome]